MPSMNISKKIFSPALFPYLSDYENRFEIYMGSAGSGKSFFITQKLILKALKSKRKVLVCRRYGTTIRHSVFTLFKDVLKSFKLLNYCKIRESDFHIELPNGSEIIFMGLDDEQKLLSIANISDIFVEELFEVPREVFEQLNLRMRGIANNQQIFGAFNPISANHWLYDYCVKQPPTSLLFSQTTFRDNPFLNQAYIDTLEDLYRTNPAKAKIFCDGEWGSDPEGLVYKNWKVEEFDNMELARKGFERRAGMDFGVTDPTTIVESYYDKQNKIIYIADCFYQRGASYEVVIESLKQMNLGRTVITADSADPMYISVLQKAGFRVEGTKKGSGSVDSGITFLQNHTLVVHPKAKELIAELDNYSYIKDKKTGVYTDKKTHEFSHSLDALRYSYEGIFQNKQMGSLDKKVLGL